MITSSSNTKLKQIIALNTKAKVRRETGLFVAEGVKLFQEMPKELREAVYVSETFEAENPALLEGIPYEVVEDKLFAKICDTQTPQGILTVARQPKYTREDLLVKSQPLLVVMEDLQDPGNVGTIIRTAEAAGADGIILTKKCVDLFAPKTIRSTMGAIFRMPFIVEDDVLEMAAWLKKSHVRTYAAHLKATDSFKEKYYRTATAFLIGNEGNGLSDALTEKADAYVKIPMMGKTESLNASVAAGLLLYEAYYQRIE